MKGTYCHPNSAPADASLCSGDQMSLAKSFPASSPALDDDAVGACETLTVAKASCGALETPEGPVSHSSFAVIIHREDISGQGADERWGRSSCIVSTDAPFSCSQVQKQLLSRGESSAFPACNSGEQSEASSGTSCPAVSDEYAGIEGYDRPDLNKALIALRLPSYLQHIKYECLQIRRFWESDMHHRDWRQTFATCYFPNVIDPLLLAFIRFSLCCCVLLLEGFSTASSVEVAGFAHFLYFTNWNSLLVAAGFVSITASSVWACLSFREQPFFRHSLKTEKHGDAKRNVVRLAKHYHAAKSPEPLEQSTETPGASELQCEENAVRCLLPVAFVSLESTDHWPPRPSYSCSKVALLPWIVQCREQHLQLSDDARPSRTSCLRLKGYVQLMADERFCVEGILFAPNPSNKNAPPRQCNLERGGGLFQRLFGKPLKALLVPKRELTRGTNQTKTKAPLETNTQGETPREEDTAEGAHAEFSIAAPADSVPEETESLHSTAPRSPPSTPGVSTPEQEASAAQETQCPSRKRTSEAPFPLFVHVTWILHSLQLVGSVVVFMIFFSLFKFEGTAFPESWVTIYKHAALVGTTFLHACLLSRIPFPLRHAVYSFVLFCVYLLVQFLVFRLQLSNGNGGVGYVYKVFSFEKAGAASATVVGVVLCFLAIHVFLWSLTRRRSLYIDPPPAVSVTANQLRRALQLASAAAAAAVGSASASASDAEARSQGGLSETLGPEDVSAEPVPTAVLAVAAAAVHGRLGGADGKPAVFERTHLPNAFQRQAHRLSHAPAVPASETRR